MKVLIVARYKQNGYAPFITEQVNALKKVGVICEFFPMHSKGIKGYLRELPELNRRIREFSPDVIHAHFGLCGLFANLQRSVPVVTTYHGSDINNPLVLRLSRIAIRLSAFNVFVSQKNIDIAKIKKNYALIPCGITLGDYPLLKKAEAREKMGLDLNKKYVLFSGAFDNPVKNESLAQAAVEMIPNAELLELKGYSRQQVSLLLYASDVFLMTSHSEGSPQVIKEALACGCPIVSVDVGDIRERVNGVKGCWIVEPDAEAVAVALKEALAFPGRTNGRSAIERDNLTNDAIASRLKSIYDSIVK